MLGWIQQIGLYLVPAVFYGQISMASPEADAGADSKVAKDLNICTVAPEVLEERKFGEDPSRIFTLSREPLGNKILTVFIGKDGRAVLRKFPSIKPLASLSVAETEELFGKAVEADNSIKAEFFGWNGKETVRFNISAKICSRKLKKYLVESSIISKSCWRSVEKAEGRN